MGPEKEEYIRLIKLKDSQGLMDLLSNLAVEAQVLERLRRKATVYGQQTGSGVNVESICDMYLKHVIPLTKRVEVEYLMQRLE